MDRATLQALPLFQAIDAHALEAIMPELKSVVFAPGSAIFREGDPPGEVYVIRTGRVLVTSRVEGQPLVHAEIGPGGIVGEMAVLEHRPRSTTVEAAEEVHAVAIPA